MTGASEVLVVPTVAGNAEVRMDGPSDPRDASVLLVLGHGAGGGAEAPDLSALANELPDDGVTVMRVVQPWRVAGKKVAPVPRRLDAAWLDVLHHLQRLGWDSPLVVGGRSAGARVACRTARQAGALAVLALAFPLHPPGRPEKSRAAELEAAGIPITVVQGLSDPFGHPDEFPPVSGLSVWPAAGDHSLSKGLETVVVAARHVVGTAGG